METKKPFYLSKTLWLNVIGLVVFAVQAKTTFLIGPEYQASILAVINLILRGVTGKPVDWELPDKIRNINLGLLLILIVPATLMLGGCAGLSKAIDEHELVTELAVRAATARVLEEHPGWVEKTYSITAEAIQVLSADEVTSLDGLQLYVTEQIDWNKLAPEEQALLTTLITAARQQIEQSLINRGVTEPGAAAVRAAKVLSWINQTAAIRLPKISGKGTAPAMACSLHKDKGSSLDLVAYKQKRQHTMAESRAAFKVEHQDQILALSAMPNLVGFDQIVDRVLDEAGAATDTKLQTEIKALEQLYRDEIARLFEWPDFKSNTLQPQILQAEQRVDDCLAFEMERWLNPAASL